MEGNFRRFLSASGIGEDGRAVLEEEGVLTSAIFGSLREEHFEKLLPKLKVGDHATLLKLWDTGPGAGTSREASPMSFHTPRRGSTSGSETSSRASSPHFILPSQPRFSPPFRAGSTPPETPSSSQTNFKELSKLYKLKAQERVERTAVVKKVPPKMMMVILGGMVYDCNLRRGIRKKYLAEPNPTKVELSRETKYDDVLQIAKRMYFVDFDESCDSLSLADSAGMPILVADPLKWTLGSFYSDNSLQPSRYKLYVVLHSGAIDKNTEQREDPGAVSNKSGDEVPAKCAIIETETVVSQCGDCGRDYRTYVPETICSLPDGGTVFYREAQTKCPLCDENSFGAFMNTDLFPELCP